MRMTRSEEKDFDYGYRLGIEGSAVVRVYAKYFAKSPDAYYAGYEAATALSNATEDR